MRAVRSGQSLSRCFNARGWRVSGGGGVCAEIRGVWTGEPWEEGGGGDNIPRIGSRLAVLLDKVELTSQVSFNVSHLHRKSWKLCCAECARFSLNANISMQLKPAPKPNADLDWMVQDRLGGTCHFCWK